MNLDIRLNWILESNYYSDFIGIKFSDYNFRFGLISSFLLGKIISSIK